MTDYGDILAGIYDFLSPEISDAGYTNNEKLYIQLKFLSFYIRSYQQCTKYVYSDDVMLDDIEKRFNQLSDLCSFEDINYGIFPFEINI